MKFRYQDSLNSDHWRNLRRLALNRAGDRCEGMVLVFAHDGVPLMSSCGAELLLVRCEATRGLQLHHLHYDSLGTEALDDVRVLCDRCHRLATVLGVLCDTCGEPVCGGVEDAYGFLETVEADRLRRANPAESLVVLTKNQFGVWCPTCWHFMGNPD